jgi:ATP synthase protein I
MADQDLRIARGAALATLAVAPVVLVAAGLLAGPKGLVGAALGTALAAGFFVVTVVVVTAAARIRPDFVLPAALGAYVLKIVALGVGLWALRDTTAFSRPAFAVATVVGACTYLLAEVQLAGRAHIPYVDDPPARTPSGPRPPRE